MRASRTTTLNGKGDPLLSRVRKLCLSLPETSEVASWGHPNFRAGKRTFVTFEHVEGVDAIAFYLHPFDVEDLQGRAGFMRTPYGQGRWVSLRIRPRPKWPEIEGLVLKSYRQVALKRMLLKLEKPDAS